MPGIRTFVHSKNALPYWKGIHIALAEAVGFEPTWPVKAKQFSRLPRYDRFDKPPYLKALKYTKSWTGLQESKISPVAGLVSIRKQIRHGRHTFIFVSAVTEILNETVKIDIVFIIDDDTAASGRAVKNFDLNLCTKLLLEFCLYFRCAQGKPDVRQFLRLF